MQKRWKKQKPLEGTVQEKRKHREKQLALLFFSLACLLACLLLACGWHKKKRKRRCQDLRKTKRTREDHGIPTTKTQSSGNSILGDHHNGKRMELWRLRSRMAFGRSRVCMATEKCCASLCVLRSDLASVGACS